jgi:hypothetical protein
MRDFGVENGPSWPTTGMPEVDPQPDTGACPFLGYLDDPAQCYARPSILHRCYAAEAEQRISSADQRTLCLSDAFPTCARFRASTRVPGIAVATGWTTDTSPEQTFEPRLQADSKSEPHVGQKPSWRRSRLARAAIGAALAGGAALVVIGLSSPLRISQEVTTAPSPAATALSTTTPAPPAVDPTAIEIPVADQPTLVPAPAALVEASFASPRPGWPERPPFVVWSGGAYRLSAAVAGHFVALSAPVTNTRANVFVRAVFHKIAGPAGGGYGIILRDQEPGQRDGVNQLGQFYVAEAGDRGQFGIWRRDNDHWVDLVPWTDSDAIHVDRGVNAIDARAIGGALELAVNGVALAHVEDQALATGSVGIFVGGDGNQVALDSFVATPVD